MRRLDVDGQTARALREGRIGPAPAGAAGRYCCFEAGGGFLGIVDVDDAGIRAIRLVRTHADACLLNRRRGGRRRDVGEIVAPKRAES